MESEREQVVQLDFVTVSSAEDMARKQEMLYELDEIDSISLLRKLTEIGENALSAKKLTGGVDDFHNLAVTFARVGLHDMCCDILERGLKLHPTAIDLLADFLSYGLECGREERCEYYYNLLVSLPDAKMTWRGYDFAIDYLMEKIKDSHDESEVPELVIQIEERLKKYKAHFPNSEDPYVSESQVLSFLGKENEAIAVLKRAMDTLAAPKCYLRYADILVKQGKYEEVVSVAQKAVSVSAQEQMSVNIPYLFYLSGMAKDALIHAEGDYKNRERVLDAYSDYKVAEELFDSTRAVYMKNLKMRVRILELKSHIPYNENWKAE